jgi:hypothetical protein
MADICKHLNILNSLKMNTGWQTLQLHLHCALTGLPGSLAILFFTSQLIYRPISTKFCGKFIYCPRMIPTKTNQIRTLKNGVLVETFQAVSVRAATGSHRTERRSCHHGSKQHRALLVIGWVTAGMFCDRPSQALFNQELTHMHGTG